MFTFPTSLFHPALAEGCHDLCLYACNMLNYRILGGGIAER